MWSALQGQMLLSDAAEDTTSTTWLEVEELYTPQLTLELADLLRDKARLAGRGHRTDRILDTARHFDRSPDALNSIEGLCSARHVTGRLAETARLVDASNANALVVNPATQRVASRFFGLPPQHHRSRSHGRLAVVRLLGGLAPSAESGHPNAAMAAILEIAARLCRPKSSDCAKCPLDEQCATSNRSVELNN